MRIEELNLELNQQSDDALFLLALKSNGDKVEATSKIIGSAIKLSMGLANAMREDKSVENLILATAYAYISAIRETNDCKTCNDEDCRVHPNRKIGKLLDELSKELEKKIKNIDKLF